ncbi:hypothetical protein GPJ81_07505 [Pseudomonas alkylphenolica]|uniref:Uncharacterized protein n=1 Tax=Pseudomonas alkylphenolica TaxID=237609 RepID=A0A6I6GQ56_9PSED|nr:hypothetical protein [Pseudomonas alkylphenolica]QGW76532.1 hypothetical protein GPJ81_07505 [Pseudomonas alkylphenolica]
MPKLKFRGLINLLESDANYMKIARGMLLYCAVVVLLLSVVGVFFSERSVWALKYFPLAVMLVAVVVTFQLSLWPVRSSTLIKAMCLILVATYLLGGGLNAYVGARIYDGPQYDGAFQLYFPLKRMDMGEWPGKDFFYFHGQLIPVLIYPLFKLFGGDFFASQIASKLVDLVVPLAYFIIFRWLGLDRVKSLLASALLIGFLVTDRFTFGTQNPIDGVHVYSLRSLIPFLYMAYLARQLADEDYVRGFVSRFYRKTVFVQASIFVVAFYLGSEQGFYLLAAMMLANFVAIGFKPLRVTLATVFLAVVSISLLLLSNEIIFGSQKPLWYLSEISKNQTWFYASYPNEFLHNALDFSRYRSSTFKVSAKLIVCLIGLPVLLWLSWLLIPKKDKQIFFFTLICGAYGLVGLTSFIASYSGEQYADNALKCLLVVAVALLVKLGFKEVTAVPQAKEKYRIPGDLIAAAPFILAITFLGCVYAIVAALSIPKNYSLHGLLKSGLFMEQPDLGVKLPLNALALQTNERGHASQFLALEYAQGNKAALVLYPEGTFVDGFNEGVKRLYRIKLSQHIPAALAVGDFCQVNDVEFSIGDIDRESNYLYFNLSGPLKKIWERLPRSISCYRKSSELYVSFNSRALKLEHNLFDNNFYDGLFRGRTLQVRVRESERARLRVGDGVVIAGVNYRITAVHANGVIVLDSSVHPLPYDFDRGATYTVTQRIEAYNNFKERLLVSLEDGGEEVVTRIIFNDLEILNMIKDHGSLVVGDTNDLLSVVNVDKSRATVDVIGYVDDASARHGFHLGDLNQSSVSVVGEIAPVFQFMKGILSVKTFGHAPEASNIDFLFHTFNSSLLADYLDGLTRLSPELITVPSGRHINNFVWYDNWLTRARWPVYEYLLRSYDPVASSKFESFWKKGKSYGNDASWISVNISKDGGQQDLTLTTHNTISEKKCNISAYEVELDYTVSGWQRRLPLLGSSARHLALIDDRLAVPLTFNPNEKTVRFPVFPTNGDTRIKIKTLSPFGMGTSIEVSAARYRQLDIPTNRIAAAVGLSESSICP